MPDNAINFVDLGRQYQLHREELDEAISKVLQKKDFILGEEVKKFENSFAAYCGAKHCIGVASGTDALFLILKALGIGPGDEVITATNSFIATGLAIQMTGAKPVFTDIDPQTYNIDVALVEKSITPKTKAIIPVHLYGQTADMAPLKSIADAAGLKIVEDACQAHGAYYKKARAGALGHAAAFSFYPGKNLGAYGDGGAVVTDDDEIADTVQMLRNYGQRKKYEHTIPGYNSRLDTMQAAIIRVKLKFLDQWNENRRANASAYNNLLTNTQIKTPYIQENCESVYHLYVIRVSKRDALLAFLADKKIYAGIHYPIPMHLQKAFTSLGYQKGDFPVAEQYAQEIISLPMFPELHEEEIIRTAKTVTDFVESSHSIIKTTN